MRKLGERLRKNAFSIWKLVALVLLLLLLLAILISLHCYLNGIGFLFPYACVCLVISDAMSLSPIQLYWWSDTITIYTSDLFSDLPLCTMHTNFNFLVLQPFICSMLLFFSFIGLVFLYFFSCNPVVEITPMTYFMYVTFTS